MKNYPTTRQKREEDIENKCEDLLSGLQNAIFKISDLKHKYRNTTQIG